MFTFYDIFGIIKHTFLAESFMNEFQAEMSTLTERFLSEHFPNDQYTIRTAGSELMVQVINKMYFKISETSVFDVVIHEDLLDSVSLLFGLDTYSTESTVVVSNFLESLNNNELFKEKFETIAPVNLDKYLNMESEFEDSYYDFYDKDTRIQLKHKSTGDVYLGVIQFSFHFTKNNTLKCLPAICLFVRNEFDFRVGFNLEEQTTHLIQKSSTTCEDFFSSNRILDFNKEIDALMVHF